MTYINDVQQAQQQGTVNVTMKEGDNLTIIARAVGNVTVVKVENVTGLNLRCNTLIACNLAHNNHNLKNRNQQCFLDSAKLSHNGTRIKFFVNYNVSSENVTVELLGEVTLTGEWMLSLLYVVTIVVLVPLC